MPASGKYRVSLIGNSKTKFQHPAKETGKGMFLSESTDVFVITPNRRTFFFPETENLNFGD